MKNLLKEKMLLICLVNIADDKLHWSIGCSEDVTFSFDQIKEKLLPLIGGKGGGRFPLWQGSGSRPEGVEAFLAACRL